MATSSVSSTSIETLFIKSDLETYAYRRLGSGPGLPLLCLQHFIGTLDNWDPAVIDQLALSREVILFENAGVGSSTGTVPETIQDMAAHALAFVAALELTSIDILGFSLGGMVAQVMALERPSLIRKMMLVGTAPEGGEDIMHMEKPNLRKVTEDPNLKGLEPLVGLFFTESEASQKAGRQFVARLLQRSSGCEPASGEIVATAQIKAFRSWEQPSAKPFSKLKRISHPCLVLNGVSDSMIPIRNSFMLAEHLPNAYLVVFPDAGHGSLPISSTVRDADQPVYGYRTVLFLNFTISNLHQRRKEMNNPRRYKGVFFSLCLSALLLGCTARSPVQAAGPTGVKNVLLVHGAWADGSSWSKVIPLLQADGYSVVAVQLPLTSLAEDVKAVQRAIAVETGSLLLVGHSYGGAVISQAGNDPKVEGLLFVNAVAPDAGESAYGLGNTVPAPVGSEIRPDAGGFLKLTDAGISNDFAQELTASEKANLAVTQGPINATDALGGTVTTPAWRSRPSWYIIGSNDRVISPVLEQTMATRMKATTITLASCHVSLLSHPTDVVAFLEKAASTLKP
jgi:pimeloyl-ACP methyl ester carboxylesterase